MSTPQILNARLRVPQVRAIPRQRLDELLDQAWQHRVTLVLAPAGSGKTTAIAEFAARAEHPVGWFTSTGCDGTAASFVSYVNSSLAIAHPGITPGWRDVNEAIEALDHLQTPIALVIDDVHTLFATPAEEALGQLIEDAPDHVKIVIGTRREPSFDLTRMRLAGSVMTIGADELRFRSWEAEQLFRDLYDTWLRPDDVARLSRRVEGWAAGLQLFHLAARTLTPPEQRRLIDRLGGQARIVRDYLAANVLGPIAPELRTFLVDTCVLGVVTPASADCLRDETGSAAYLRELAESHLFTVALDDNTYRYHEVMRSQLEALLYERDGEEVTAQRYRAAARLLEAEGQTYEALRCYAHASEWGDVRRLANPEGSEAAAGSAHWIVDIPASIVADDAWLLLARARAELASGRFSAAAASFQQAESKAIGAEVANRCSAERTELNAWLDTRAPAPTNWILLARQGCRRDPAGAAAALERTGEPTSLVVAGALLIVAGQAEQATTVLERVLGEVVLTPWTYSAAVVSLATARLLQGSTSAGQALDEAAAYAERVGAGWVARIARAVLALTRRANGVEEATRVGQLCEIDGDPWGAAFAALLAGLGGARSGRTDPSPISALRNAAERFRELGATALQSVALLGAAACLDRAGDPDAVRAEAEARALSHSSGTSAARGLLDGLLSAGTASVAGLAGISRVSGTAGLNGTAGSNGTAGLSATADAPDTSGAISNGASKLDREAASSVAGGSLSAPMIESTCFGRFAVRVGGNEISFASLRPRARTLLRLLVVNAGAAVHREVIVDALWPESDRETGVRNLQVAISAVRKALSDAGVADELGVVRQDEGYRVVFAGGDGCDVVRFRTATSAVKMALANVGEDAAFEAAMAALREHRGELLAEDGPAEWAQPARQLVGKQFESAAVLAATGYVKRRQFVDAAELCEMALVSRPFADGLWRLLIQAHRDQDNVAAAAEVQTRYDKMLAEVG